MTDALSTLRRATTRRRSSRDAWRAAIVAARAAGVPIRAIGEAAGISHVRVLQILEELELKQLSELMWGTDEKFPPVLK